MVVFLVALASVILFGTGDCFPSWLSLGFMRQCYELEPDILVTFLVALAAVILFGCGCGFRLGRLVWGAITGWILRSVFLSFCLL